MSDFSIADIIGKQIGGVSKLDTSREVVELPINEIKNNVRNFYRVECDEDLRNSIELNGLLEPLLVVKNGDGYRLISGHRRMKALRELNEVDAEKWPTAPCIILPPMSDDEEVVAVIEANRQRVKSSYELGEEAKRLTDAYTEMKKSGKELPGKIRDRVAEAMKISAAHVARLNAIRQNLTLPGFVKSYKEGDIPESVAYEISKLSREEQTRLLDYTINHHCGLSIPIVRRVSSLCAFFRRCRHLNSGMDLCPNAEVMYDNFVRHGELSGCAGCCEMCNKRETCPHVCQYCKPEKMQNAGADAPGTVMDTYNDLQKQYPELSFDRLRKSFCGRLKSLRESSGKSKKEFAEGVGLYQATYSAYENASLPGVDTLPRIARALGVSTDYLLGLSDAENGGAHETVWYPLDVAHWPKEGQLVVLAYENSIGGYGYQIARCVAGSGDDCPFDNPNGNTTITDYTDYERWTPIEEERK